MISFLKNFIQSLKVTLQLLENIGCIPCAVQYILEPILHPVVYISHFPTPVLPPPPPPHWQPLVCSLYL